MRLIIEPDYNQLSKWAANYVIERINAATNHIFIVLTFSL